MNPTTLRMGYRATKAAWHKVQEFKNDKAAKAYDGLLEAANSAEDLSGDASKKLSSVLEQSKKRLEKAKAEASDTAEDLEKRGKKAFEDVRAKAEKKTKITRKQARKAAKQAKKDANKKFAFASRKAEKAQAKLGKKKSCKGKKFGLFALLLAVLGGIAYAVARLTKDAPSDQPPRVEDFGADAPKDSKLVYSTTTEDDQTPQDTAADAAAAAQPAEGTPDRDEELLKSIDEQIAKHRLREDDES